MVVPTFKRYSVLPLVFKPVQWFELWDPSKNFLLCSKSNFDQLECERYWSLKTATNVVPKNILHFSSHSPSLDFPRVPTCHQHTSRHIVAWYQWNCSAKTKTMCRYEEEEEREEKGTRRRPFFNGLRKNFSQRKNRRAIPARACCTCEQNLQWITFSNSANVLLFFARKTKMARKRRVTFDGRSATSIKSRVALIRIPLAISVYLKYSSAHFQGLSGEDRAGASRPVI